jgi:hypothetical protein
MRAARALTVCGVRAASGIDVTRRGRGAYRLWGGGVYSLSVSKSLVRSWVSGGGQGTIMGVTVPGAIGWTGPEVVMGSVSASKPRSYRSWAAGG